MAIALIKRDSMREKTEHNIVPATSEDEVPYTFQTKVKVWERVGSSVGEK